MEGIFFKSSPATSKWNLEFLDIETEKNFINYLSPMRKQVFYFVCLFLVLFKLLSVIYVLLFLKNYTYVILTGISMIIVIVISLLSKYEWYGNYCGIVKMIIFIFVYLTEIYLIFDLALNNEEKHILVRYVYLLIICSCSSSLFFQQRQFVVMGVIFSINLTIFIIFASLDKPVIFEIFVNCLAFFISFKLDHSSSVVMRRLFLNQTNSDRAFSYVNSIYDGLNSLIISCVEEENFIYNQKVKDIIYSSQETNQNENTDFKSFFNTKSLFKKNNERLEVKTTSNNVCGVLNSSEKCGKIIECDLTVGMLQLFNLIEIKDNELKNHLTLNAEPNLYNILQTIKVNTSLEPFDRFKILGYFEFYNKKPSHLSSSKALSVRSVGAGNKDQSYYEVFYRKVHIEDSFLIEFLINDVTTIKQLEFAKIENKYKHKIMSKIAHEFKTPIIALISLANKMLQKKKSNYSNLKQIYNLSHYIIYLVNDIIEYANSEKRIKVYPKEIELEPLMDFFFSVLKMMIKHKKKKVNLNLFIEENLTGARITSDFMRIHQIMFNLITNAVKYTTTGEIKLKAKKNPISEAIVISVEDTGKGMSASRMNIVNNEISNLKINIEEDYNKVGSCIGLLISKKIAKEINSKLFCESEIGKGSKFFLEINNLLVTGSTRKVMSQMTLVGTNYITVNSPVKNRKESAFDIKSNSLHFDGSNEKNFKNNLNSFSEKSEFIEYYGSKMSNEEEKIGKRMSSQSSRNDSSDDEGDIKLKNNKRYSIIKLDEIPKLSESSQESGESLENSESESENNENSTSKKGVSLKFNLNISNPEYSSSQRTMEKRFTISNPEYLKKILESVNSGKKFQKSREKKKSRSSKFIKEELFKSIFFPSSLKKTRRNSSKTINQINNININLPNQVTFSQNPYVVNINCENLEKINSKNNTIMNDSLEKNPKPDAKKSTGTRHKSIFFSPSQKTGLSPEIHNLISSHTLDKKVILVIDDYKFCREMLINCLKLALGKHSEKVEIIQGQDGVELLYNLAQGMNLLCVFIDENMDFMLGSEAISIMRQWEKTKSFNGVKVVSVTAFSDEITKGKIINAGCDMIVNKPASKSNIEHALVNLGIMKIIEEIK